MDIKKIHESDLYLFNLHKKQFKKFCVSSWNFLIDLRDSNGNILYYNVIIDSFKDFEKDDFISVVPNDSLIINYEFNILDHFDVKSGSYYLSVIYFNCDRG